MNSRQRNSRVARLLRVAPLSAQPLFSTTASSTGSARRTEDSWRERVKRILTWDLPDRVPSFRRVGLGIFVVQFSKHNARARRRLAASLDEFAKAGAAEDTAPKAQIFVVGNPHDQAEMVDLTVRPISLSPDWKLTIVNAPTTQPSSGKLSAPQVSEIRAGEHYQVSLPAKSEVRVMAVVVPVGETGVNTTARFAVEGRIGNELLGGVVHDMHVPALLSDMKLAPVWSNHASSARWLRPLIRHPVFSPPPGIVCPFPHAWAPKRRERLRVYPPPVLPTRQSRSVCDLSLLTNPSA